MERTTENSIFRDFFDEININKEIKNSCTTQIIAAALFSRNGFKNDLATDKTYFKSAESVFLYYAKCKKITRERERERNILYFV